MDIYRLNRLTFLPDKLIEGLSSKVWTERHKEFGDFQLKTPRIASIRELLPEGSLITIGDSLEVMMVETHAISTTEKKIKELTITGRTLEAFLENRFLTGPYQTPWPMKQPYTIQDALCVLIWNSVINPTTQEVVRPYAWDHLLRDNIPNVVVTDSIRVQKDGTGEIEDLQTGKQWWLETGSIYPQLQSFMNLGGNVGIRVVRPPTSGVLPWVVTVGPDGYTYRTHPARITSLRFDIYNGRNRSGDGTSDQDQLPPLSFRYDLGHLENPNYLFSVREKKNLIHIQSSIKSVEIYAGETGLDLYGEWLDGGTIANSVSPTDFEKALMQKALAEYNLKKRQQIVDGAIPANVPFKFGPSEQGGDYYLGDLVQVVGEYGVKNTMQVNEFIRTEDKGIEKAYPTLVVPQ